MNVNKTAGIIESEHILLDLCNIYDIYIINITFMVKLRWRKKLLCDLFGSGGNFYANIILIAFFISMWCNHLIIKV